MNATHNTTENRDGKAILLKLTPTDRQRAEAAAADHYLPLTTWAYQAFKKALDHHEASTAGKSISESTPTHTQ